VKSTGLKKLCNKLIYAFLYVWDKLNNIHVCIYVCNELNNIKNLYDNKSLNLHCYIKLFTKLNNKIQIMNKLNLSTKAILVNELTYEYAYFELLPS